MASGISFLHHYHSAPQLISHLFVFFVMESLLVTISVFVQNRQDYAEVKANGTLHGLTQQKLLLPPNPLQTRQDCRVAALGAKAL